MTFAEQAAISLLAALFLIAVAGQTQGQLVAWLRHWDLFELVPAWNFFAPRPGRFDYHLLFRDEVAAGWTGWREVRLYGERCWFDCLWNRRRRLKKAVFDATGAIQTEAGRGNADPRLTIPYLLLLMVVSGLARTYPASRTQFLVMISTASTPEQEPEEIIRSDQHPL